MLTKSTLIAAVAVAIIGIAQRPPHQELNEFRKGDYYAPSNAFREGGALRPLPVHWLDCSRKFRPSDTCTWAW
jgi:hypothetical protein